MVFWCSLMYRWYSSHLDIEVEILEIVIKIVILVQIHKSDDRFLFWREFINFVIHSGFFGFFDKQ
jgi:hypothetical protein